MIENYNASKQPSNGEFIDIKKYIGVASVKVLSINPNNETLRKWGWPIAEGAPEPEYIKQKQDENGNVYQLTRIRFLVQIQDLEDKPVIYMDYMCRPDIALNKDGSKCEIIDQYGRSAWATKEEVKGGKIPQYANGPARIALPYKISHRGEKEIIAFLFKLLNITPLEVYDRTKGAYVRSTNPGRLSIDNWGAICNGNVRELAEYIALRPDNCVKVVLGIQTTPDNRTYQAFLNTGYIGNGSRPDQGTGEYTAARNLIDKYMAGRENSNYAFSAMPVREWTVSPTEVTDASESTEEPADNWSDPGDLPF